MKQYLGAGNEMGGPDQNEVEDLMFIVVGVEAVEE